MNEFKGYKRRMELLTQIIKLTDEERVELNQLEDQLAEFRKLNPDWQPGNQSFKVTLGDMLKAKK